MSTDQPSWHLQVLVTMAPVGKPDKILSPYLYTESFGNVSDAKASKIVDQINQAIRAVKR